MKLYSKIVISLWLLVLLVGTGCYTMNQVGTPTNKTIKMTNAENATTASHFNRKKTVNHFVYGLVSPDDVGIEKMVSDAVEQAGGTGAVNVRVKYQQTFINGLVSGLTGGLYSPFTLWVEGDVVK